MEHHAPIYDDIDIGQVFSTDEFLVTAENIKQFASQFDPQPMHLDEVAAADGPFGKLTASGWQTLSLTMRLMAQARPFGDTSVIGVGVDNIRFVRPVYPDTRIFVSAEVTGKRHSSKPGRGYVNMQLATKDAATGEDLVTQTWMVMVPA